MSAALAYGLAAAGEGGLAAVVYDVPLVAAEEDDGVVVVAHVMSRIG